MAKPVNNEDGQRIGYEEWKDYLKKCPNCKTKESIPLRPWDYFDYKCNNCSNQFTINFSEKDFLIDCCVSLAGFGILYLFLLVVFP